MNRKEEIELQNKYIKEHGVKRLKPFTSYDVMIMLKNKRKPKNHRKSYGK
jgi:molybdopterin-guanine dinucleotide biosynthesis protein A